MAPMMECDVMPNEDRVLHELDERGSCSLEDLPELVGLDWGAVFSVVDRLSRAGQVTLRRHGAGYLVSTVKRP